MSQSLTPRSNAAYSKLKALRDAGYTGPVNQDGYPAPETIRAQHPARPWYITSRIALWTALAAAIAALVGVVNHSIVTIAVGVPLTALMYLLAVYAESQVDLIDNTYLVCEPEAGQ